MSDEMNDIIITHIQAFPHLYNKKDPSYRDLIKRENSWKTIAILTGMTVNDCQTRWKSLRDRYCREKKKADVLSGSGAISISQSSQQLNRSMSFLDAVVHHRKTSGNYGAKSFSKTDMKERTEIETIPIDETSTSTQPSASGMYSRRMVLSSAMKKVETQFHNENSALPQSFICFTPPLSSPAANPSPSPTNVPKASIPVRRFRTISSSDRQESSSSTSNTDPSLREEMLTEIDSFDPVSRTLNIEPTERRLKRVRNDEVNVAIINAFGSLSSTKKLREHEPPKAGQLYAESLVAELQRFPPRKRTFINGELMQLIAQYDETELQ